MRIIAAPLFLALTSVGACSASDAGGTAGGGKGQAKDASYSTGLATETQAELIDCGRGSRVSAVGAIKSDDNKSWTVPAPNNFATAPKAADLYNECGGKMLANRAALDLASVPLMDAGGDEEFAVYIFADNYFELYVNGKLLAVDPVPFTPFNSNVVRFKAKRPLTIALMAVDWEENLGIGSEENRGSSYHPGDAGLVAHVQDTSGKTVAITDRSWKAQTFYTSPLNDRACLVDMGNVRDSSTCNDKAASYGSTQSAVHWTIPKNWMVPEFDDASWPNSVTYSNDIVGVDNKPAYTNFASVFDASGADAEFIWSSNLILDNLVLLRKTVK